MRSFYKLFILGVLVVTFATHPLAQAANGANPAASCACLALLFTSSTASHKEEAEQLKAVAKDAAQYMMNRDMNNSAPSYLLDVSMKRYQTVLVEKNPSASNLTFDELVELYLQEFADCQN